MSFVNIGYDGPPNHTLEVDGDMFVSNVEDGTNAPVEIKGNLRLRTKPPTGLDEYRVTDMNVEWQGPFGITVPSADASGSITDFCIDKTGNVGIGTVPTEKLDVDGSMFATGNLRNESNLITGTLSSSGILTCNSIAYGENSNIYGLLPSGTILMTTLTNDPPGWTDVTDSLSFTSNLIMLAENETSLTTGGNNNFIINSNYSHNHNWATTHAVSHAHNVAKGTMDSSGRHYHDSPATKLEVNQMEDGSNQHYHNANMRNLVRGMGAYSSYFGNSVLDAISDYGQVPEYVTVNQNSYHDHGSGKSYYFNQSNMNHSHNYPNTDQNGSLGGNHTHTFIESGSNSNTDGDSFSILPASYGIRFIKRN